MTFTEKLLAFFGPGLFKDLTKAMINDSSLSYDDDYEGDNHREIFSTPDFDDVFDIEYPLYYPDDHQS